MARPRRHPSTISLFALFVALFLLAVMAGVAAGTVIFWMRKPPTAGNPPVPSPAAAPGFEAKTRAVFTRSPLDRAGKFKVKVSPADAVPPFLAWEGRSSTELIIAEKAVADLWSREPGLEVKVSYPEHSPQGERVRLTALTAGAPVFEVLLYLRPKKPKPDLPPASPPKPLVTRLPDGPSRSAKIAIIIDDIGNDLPTLESFLALQVPITYSVFPSARHSREAGDLILAAGNEVMLHMPMEPLNYPESYPGDGALLLGMTPAEIRDRLAKALAAVPMAKGLNNHMGSAFTTDAAAMKVVMGFLKEKGLYFVDSRTYRDTQAYILAEEMKVPAAQRKVFLDDDQDPALIRSQLLALAAAAQQEGAAIGIGHPHPATLQALRETLPEIRAAGYKLVFASEVVK